MSIPILVIRLIPTGMVGTQVAGTDDPVECVVFHAGEPVGSVGVSTLGEIARFMADHKIPEHSRLVLLLPAEEVVLTRVKVPENQRRHRDRLVPFILEEHLNENVADVFFATEWLIKSHDVGVAYLSKHRLEQWVTILEQQGLRPDFIYPEHYLLPHQDNYCYAFFDQGRLLVRHDHWSASVAPLELATQWLQSVLEEHWRQQTSLRQAAQDLPDVTLPEWRMQLLVHENDEAGLQLSQHCEKFLQDLMQSLIDDGQTTAPLTEADDLVATASPAATVPQGIIPPLTAPEPLQVKRLLVSQSMTEILAVEAVRLVSEHHHFQLLQGSFKSARRKRKSKYNWQLAAGVLAAFVAVELTYTTAKTLSYERAYSEARAENIALFKQTFPQVTRIRGDLRRALSSERAKGGSGSDGASFLELLAVTGQSLNNAKGLMIQRMAFDSGQRSLRVDLQVEDYPELEQIQQSIEAKALQVKIDGATKDDEGVRARLRIAVS